ncbi:MFS transporter [Ktedonospora formicarum]|uniref:MFS transporter n=1 Tax=Ktedonospora formicarum TaxID=2778364 RepID=A0A8J3HYP9_9CHLR|nr:MFS transporter [Ktedonospora formicarum]GHO46184.1 MFS transporter [Ktedonospora formicarum]
MAKTSSMLLPDSQVAPRAERSGRWRKSIILAAISLGYFMVLMDGTIVNVSLPAISHDLGGGLVGLQWVVNAYTLVFASLLLSAGALADQFGAKRIFISGLVLFMLASGISSFSPSLEVLIIMRALLGVGAAAITSTTLVIITHEFSDPAERARAVGLYAAITGIAFASGPVFGGILVDTLGWHSIFLVNVPVALICIALTMFLVRETRRNEQKRLDPAGQFFAILMIATLTYVLIESQNLGWSSPLILIALGLAIVSTVAFLIIESRIDSPMLPLKLFANPIISAGMAAGLLINFGMAGILFVMSLFFQQGLGYSALIAGLAFLPLTLPITFNPILTSRLVNRFGARLPMITGFVLVMGGMLLQSVTDTNTSYIVIAIALILIGFGISQVLPSLITTIMTTASKEQAGIASGALNASRQLGAVLGVAILGLILNANSSFISGLHQSLLFTAGVQLLGLLVILFFVRMKRS